MGPVSYVRLSRKDTQFFVELFSKSQNAGYSTNEKVQREECKEYNQTWQRLEIFQERRPISCIARAYCSIHIRCDRICCLPNRPVYLDVRALNVSHGHSEKINFKNLHFCLLLLLQPFVKAKK